MKTGIYLNFFQNRGNWAQRRDKNLKYYETRLKSLASVSWIFSKDPTTPLYVFTSFNPQDSAQAPPVLLPGVDAAAAPKLAELCPREAPPVQREGGQRGRGQGKQGGRKGVRRVGEKVRDARFGMCFYFCEHPALSWYLWCRGGDISATCTAHVKKYSQVSSHLKTVLFNSTNPTILHV